MAITQSKLVVRPGHNKQLYQIILDGQGFSLVIWLLNWQNNIQLPEIMLKFIFAIIMCWN